MGVNINPDIQETENAESQTIEIEEQKIVSAKLERIFQVFKASEGSIRPHFMMTGPSGCGKSYIIEKLANKEGVGYLEVNAAQLTREGTAGNSLSKALSPLMNNPDKLCICFVDEFDKLFISGNDNSMLAHEVTNGVQNEFLKLLESKQTSVFGDWGKYNTIPIDNVLFVFAGAFNGEDEITVDRLREFGIKTEFLGRVGLIFNLTKLSLESMKMALENSQLLDMYMDLFHEEVSRERAIEVIYGHVCKVHDKNTLGIRLLNTLINQFFINDGKLADVEVEKVSFQNKLTFNK